MQLPLTTAVFSAFCPFGFLSPSTPTLVLIGLLRFVPGVLLNTPGKRQHRLQMDSLPPVPTKLQYWHVLCCGPRLTAFTLTLRHTLCRGRSPVFSVAPDLRHLIIPDWYVWLENNKAEHAGGLRRSCWAEVSLLRPCTFRGGWSSAVVSEAVFSSLRNQSQRRVFF